MLSQEKSGNPGQNVSSFQMATATTRVTRLCEYLANFDDILLWTNFEITQLANFWPTFFPRLKVMHKFGRKRATFWASFYA
jgi:hypothetical protein